MLGLLVALRIWDPVALEVLRLKVFDMFVSTQPRDADPQPIDLGNGQLRPPGKDLVRVIDIDEESLGEIGQWPWSRAKVAELILKLHQMGAATVGLDIVFSEPDRLSPAILAEEMAGLRSALEESGPVRYALAGLLAVRKEKSISTMELKREIKKLLEQYNDIEHIVYDVKEALLSIDGETHKKTEAVEN